MRVLEDLHQNKTEGKWKEIKPERGVEGGLNALKKGPEPAAAHPARNQPGGVYPSVVCTSAQGSIYLIYRHVIYLSPWIHLRKLGPILYIRDLKIFSGENNRFLPDPSPKIFSAEFYHFWGISFVSNVPFTGKPDSNFSGGCIIWGEY